MSTPRTDQRRTLHLTDIQQALTNTLTHLNLNNTPTEQTPVENTLRRTLQEDIKSETDIPPHNTAAMDGYATISTTTTNATPQHPIQLKVTGKLLETTTENLKIKPGEAAYIALGTPLPEGADTVARLERVKPTGEHIELRQPIEKWKDVSLQGEDITKGQTVLSKGNPITAHDIGTLIALGKRTVHTAKKPTISILSVGDELTPIDNPTPRTTVNNYAYIISNLITELDATPLILGISKDNITQIRTKIEEGLQNSDMILTIGGCSVGVKDYVPDAINEIGSPGIVAHGMKINAFRAAGIGVSKGKPIVMLPGSAVSAVGAFYTLAVPILNILSGLKPDARPPTIHATLSDDLSPKKGLRYFAPVHIKTLDGAFIAEPLRYGTNLLSNLVKARGYIYAQEDEQLRKGDRVKAHLFSPSELLRLNP